MENIYKKYQLYVGYDDYKVSPVIWMVQDVKKNVPTFSVVTTHGLGVKTFQMWGKGMVPTTLTLLCHINDYTKMMIKNGLQPTFNSLTIHNLIRKKLNRKHYQCCVGGYNDYKKLQEILRG